MAGASPASAGAAKPPVEDGEILEATPGTATPPTSSSGTASPASPVSPDLPPAPFQAAVPCPEPAPPLPPDVYPVINAPYPPVAPYGIFPAPAFQPPASFGLAPAFYPGAPPPPPAPPPPRRERPLEGYVYPEGAVLLQPPDDGRGEAELPGGQNGYHDSVGEEQEYVEEGYLEEAEYVAESDFVEEDGRRANGWGEGRDRSPSPKHEAKEDDGWSEAIGAKYSSFDGEHHGVRIKSEERDQSAALEDLHDPQAADHLDMVDEDHVHLTRLDGANESAAVPACGVTAEPNGKIPDSALFSKPMKRPSLIELREKVVRSLKEKKRLSPSNLTPIANGVESVRSQTPDDLQPSPSNQNEHEGKTAWHHLVAHANNVKATHAKVQQRLIIEFSDEDSSDEQAAPPMPRPVLKRKRTRSEQVEEMKIRMVQLGQCPAALQGNSNASDRTSSPVLLIRSSPMLLAPHQRANALGTAGKLVSESDAKTAPASQPISELKQRIAHLERMRLHKKQRTSAPADEQTLDTVKHGSKGQQALLIRRANAHGKSLVRRPTHDLALTHSSDRAQAPPHPKNRRSDHVNPSTSRSLVSLPKGRSRYYAEEESKRKDKPAITGPSDGTSDDTGQLVEAWGDAPSARSNEVNGRHWEDEGCPSLQHNRYRIAELQSDLHIAQKQLVTLQDYSKLVHAADVSVAQAAARLSFKRQRLARLKEEINRARFEVHDAEQDYQKIGRAAQRIRASLLDIPHSDELFPRLDFTGAKPEEDTEVEQPDFTAMNSHDASNSTTELLLTRSLNTDKRPGGLSSPKGDLILQASPYSPSTGDYFASCLTGLRSYDAHPSIHYLSFLVEHLFFTVWKGAICRISFHLTGRHFVSLPFRGSPMNA